MIYFGAGSNIYCYIIMTIIPPYPDSNVVMHVEKLTDIKILQNRWNEF